MTEWTYISIKYISTLLDLCEVQLVLWKEQKKNLLVSHYSGLVISKFFWCRYKHTDYTGCWQQAGFCGTWRQL